MTYQEAIEYLYAATPVFQQVGTTAYKPGLETTHTLDTHYGHPHRCYRTIHVGGTNGKGSTSHTIAAVLQASGYRVGLFTSPHLLDFRERIRVNGEMVSEDFVYRFVEDAKPLIEERSPSFFEITTLMAFDYFRQAQVDFAVIEVGLGGRLDCTNIISPIASVITSISKDHTQLLGDTLEAIAREKAGIIKPHTPVIIGRGESPEVREVFVKKATEEEAPIIFAEEAVHIKAQTPEFSGQSFTLEGKEALPYHFGLGGLVQRDNFRAIYATIQELRSQGITISEEAFRDGLRDVVSLTGLRGRWEVLSQHPTLICDTAHNEDGVRYIVEQLRSLQCPLHIIFGMVNDKDIRGVLQRLPKEARYYFTAASVPRALAPEDLQALAEQYGLQGATYSNVHEALVAARKAANPDTDVLFVGGSNFLISDLLADVSNTDIN
ncbi:folylpolyglutamate synthase/dihydrofolate synthase family protein [uncultured Porphyromonas sp.]|jgi:bifunctional protein folC|uniref:bifunctional folylpolyglutamate synthase/dihydrofolate synthase n=1 Tax=uncultured Porphyromonas sp. TaxID=159274 RepID=UPI0026047C6F|nr:folylpolyglutamate synthase/dihydrofolate synthase family protein [uncultured Porphyromonas sp.]